MKGFAMTSVAVVLLARTSVLGTPPGASQPFDCTFGGTTSCAADDTGCVPETTVQLKCAGRLSRGLAKAIRAITECHRQQADSAFNGNPVDDEFCEGAVRQRLDVTLRNLIPLCTAAQMHNAEAREAELFAGQDNSSSIDGRNAAVYCDGPSDIDPAGDDAGRIPATVQNLQCADTLGNEIGRLTERLFKCHQKMARAFLSGLNFDEEQCEGVDPVRHASALDRYAAAMDHLDATGLCTQPCLSRSNRDSVGTTLRAEANAANAGIFPCSTKCVPYLVKDLNPGPPDSVFTEFLNVNGTLFFSAMYALWKSDGTDAGTVQLTVSSSDPSNLTDVNGTLFFAGTEPDTGRELWKSDGTAAGTMLVRDIHPGPANSNPLDLTDVNGILFFAAYNPSTGLELWKSDGTEAGTVLVKDINPGPGYSISERFISSVSVNGTLFFGANDGATGLELWKSDGTEGGTMLVKDINPGPGDSNPFWLTNVDGMLLFSARETDTGASHLWKTDGTEAGTKRIHDVLFPSMLTNVNGTVFFEGVGTREQLWKSDGTATGTVLVKDIRPLSYYSQFVNVNGTLFLVADDGTHGFELWKSDGTADGTVLVKDIGRKPYYVSLGLALNGTLFFDADDGTHGFELWKSDGTAAGTLLVSDIYRGARDGYPGGLTNVNGRLFFAANDPDHGRELWACTP